MRTDNELFNLEPGCQIEADFLQSQKFLNGLTRCLLEKRVLNVGDFNARALCESVISAAKSSCDDLCNVDHDSWLWQEEQKVHLMGMNEATKRLGKLIDILNGDKIMDEYSVVLLESIKCHQSVPVKWIKWNEKMINGSINVNNVIKAIEQRTAFLLLVRFKNNNYFLFELWSIFFLF